MLPMICVAGKNDIASNVLTRVVEAVGRERVVVLPNRDDTGRHTWQRSLRQTARRLDVPLVALSEVQEIEGLVFLSVEFDRILIPERFRTPSLYNIHFSLLPRYKGVYTAIWPLLNGEKQTGVTLHRIESGIDTGPIIDQVAFPIAIDDTSRSVYHKCLALGEAVIVRNLPRLMDGSVTALQQPQIDSSYYALGSINFRHVDVDLRRTAYQIHNTLRAFCFPEYQLPMVHGHRIRGSELTSIISVGKAGAVVSEQETEVTIHTIDYDLRLFKDFSLALFEAVAHGDEEAVGRLAPMTHDVNATNRQGWSALMMAAYREDLNIAATLIANGADVNQSNRSGTSVLMYAKTAAAQSGHTALLELLIRHGARVDVCDEDGVSVMEYARREGNPKIIEFLARQESQMNGAHS